MPINIKNTETEALARKLADLTGETITETVRHSLRERLHRLSMNGKRDDPFVRKLLEYGDRFAELPVYDTRTPDEILGYDESGLPR
jgi:antitoxin VapB